MINCACNYAQLQYTIQQRILLANHSDNLHFYPLTITTRVRCLMEWRSTSTAQLQLLTYRRSHDFVWGCTFS